MTDAVVVIVWIDAVVVQKYANAWHVVKIVLDVTNILEISIINF